jgi:hypothetical protein
MGSRTRLKLAPIGNSFEYFSVLPQFLHLTVVMRLVVLCNCEKDKPTMLPRMDHLETNSASESELKFEVRDR